MSDTINKICKNCDQDFDGINDEGQLCDNCLDEIQESTDDLESKLNQLN